MKSYNEFDKMYIGGSDGASLILASYQKLQYLYFGEDNDYKAWFVDEVIEIYRAGEMGCLIYAPGGYIR